MKILILFLSLMSCALASKYQDDINYKSSAEANSYELPFFVNGKLCNGHCSVQVDKGLNTTIYFMAKPYDRDLRIKCSNNLGYSKEKLLKAKQDFFIQITKKRYQNLLEWDCSISVLPHDRSTSGAIGRFFILLSDVDYIKRVEPNLTGNKLIFGRFSYLAMVMDNHGRWYNSFKKPYIELKDNISDLCYYTESYKMRVRFGCLKLP